MPKSYIKSECYWCGRRISSNGLAATAHFKACKVRLGKERAPKDSMFGRALEEARREAQKPTEAA